MILAYFVKIRRYKMKTVVVALDKKSDIAAFLNFIANEKESCNIVFTAIDLPCWTTDDSILTIGEILNAYVYSITEVQHEVIGMFNWNTIDDLYYSMLKEVNFAIDRYGFPITDLAEVTMRLLLRQKIAEIYNTDTIIMGEYNDPTKLSTNSATINVINSLMPVKTAIEFIDPKSTVVDEFIVSHDIDKYASFREYRFERAEFDKNKINAYTAYIANNIKPFIDKALAEDIDMGQIKA